MRWRLSSLVVLALLAATAAVLISRSRSHQLDAKPAWVGDGETPNARHEAADEAHQAKFDRGRQGGRPAGPSSPAAEQVGNRAYPRNYVDDRLAAKSLTAFQPLPGTPAKSHAPAPLIARAAVTGPWSELGPITPNVAGRTRSSSTRRRSPGPTHAGVRPRDGAGDRPRLPGQATAGSGSRRPAAGSGARPTLLPAPSTWTPPPNDLPTNAFGSLYYDAAHNVLYAGSGEPNGSGDSEAGLGLFRSTDGGATGASCPAAPRSPPTARSARSRSIRPTRRPDDLHRHRRRPARVLVGQRRPRTPPGRPGARRLPVDRRRRDVHARDGSAGQDAAEPEPAERRRGLVPGRRQQARVRPQQPEAALRRHHRAMGSGAPTSRPRARRGVGLPHDEPDDFSDPNNPSATRPATGPIRPASTSAARPGPISATRQTTGSSTTIRAPRCPRRGASTTSAARRPPSGQRRRDHAGDRESRLDRCSRTRPTARGFAAYGWCQNGQCGYDEFVAHPPGASPTRLVRRLDELRRAARTTTRTAPGRRRAPTGAP